MDNVLTQLRIAITMLSNYASEDERNGDLDDAAFTRSAINEMIGIAASYRADVRRDERVGV